MSDSRQTEFGFSQDYRPPQPKQSSRRANGTTTPPASVPPLYLRRPLGVLAWCAALVLGGLLAWYSLPATLLPPLSQPRLNVVTVYAEAPPQEVEALVTRRLESALGTVAGLERMESSSSQGYSLIRLYFAWDAKLDHMASEVREKLDTLADALPRRAEVPLVLTFDPDAEPLVTLGLWGGDELAMRRWAEEELSARLEVLPGVAAATPRGGLSPEVLVAADLGGLSARGLDLTGLAKGLEQAGINEPAGQIQLGGRELPVRTMGRFQSAGQVAQALLPAGADGAPVKVEEVARVGLGPARPTAFCRVDGQPAVLVEVLAEPGADAPTVSAAVAAETARLASRLPQGWTLVPVEDRAPLIDKALGNLGGMALLGCGLAFVVLLVFLRRPLPALLTLLPAPLAILATMGVLWSAGVGLNLMSLGGLALGVGMLVDASVVVLEAVWRHRAAGREPAQALPEALAEVRGGLMAATATTLTACLPFLLLAGPARQLFHDLALALAAALCLALLLAIWMLPALLGLLGRRMGTAPTSVTKDDDAPPLPSGLWSWWPAAVALFGVAAVVGGLCMARTGAQLLPTPPAGQVAVTLELPPEMGLERLMAVGSVAEDWLGHRPGVARLVTRGGREQAAGAVRATDPAQARRVEIMAQLAPGEDLAPEAVLAGLGKLFDPSVRVSAGRPGWPGLDDGQAPRLASILGPDLDTLAKLGQDGLERLRGVPRLADLGLSGAAQSQELTVEVDRAAAADLGVTVEQIAQDLRRAVQGEVVGHLLDEGREIDIRVRLVESQQNPAGLAKLPLVSRSERLVELGQAARLMARPAPQEIQRLERRRAVHLTGQVAGESFSRGLDQARDSLADLALPAGYELVPGGQGQSLGSPRAILGSFLLALALVFVVLVAKFESFGRPWAVLLSLPPVLLGPGLVLVLAGMPLSLPALLGCVVLLGMALGGSILVVDRACQYRDQGLEPRQAAWAAARRRARPVLMTSLTTVLGAAPLALGGGEAGLLGRPLALVVIAGLLTALPANLVLAPILFGLWEGRGGRQ